jgi:hypothetical protein
MLLYESGLGSLDERLHFFGFVDHDGSIGHGVSIRIGDFLLAEFGFC